MASGASDGRGRRPAVAEPPPLRPDGLQLHEDRRFQERWWTAERIAQGAFWLLIAAALAGFSGKGGPFATAALEAGGGRADYPRVARWQGPDEVRAAFGAARATHRLVLAGAPDWFAVESVQPAPLRSTATRDAFAFEFAGAGEGAIAIVRLRPKSPGLVRWAIGLDDAPPAPAATLVLP